MSKKTLTATAVKSAKPESRAYRLPDQLGLFLWVTPAGGKSWRFRYRWQGKEQTLTFGPYPEISLAEARRLHAEARALLAEGENPREQQREQEQEQRNRTLTFGMVAERWFKGHTEHARRPWAPATARRARMYLDKDLLPALGRKPIKDITRLDLIGLNERVEKRGAFTIAQKMRGWLAAIFDEAADRGEIPFNPALRLKPSHYARGVQQAHFPFVPFSELPELLAAVDAGGANLVVKWAIRMLLYTGARTGELRLSEWDEWDMDAGLWTIPAERTKQRRAQLVPLPSQAVAIMRQLAGLNPELPFTLTGNRPFSEMTINKALAGVGYKGRQTGHGFRHLISTELHDRGYQSDWIEMQLGHKVGSGTVRGVYNHAEYLEQRRGMMQAWADTIDAATTGATVAAIRRNKA